MSISTSSCLRGFHQTASTEVIDKGEICVSVREQGRFIPADKNIGAIVTSILGIQYSEHVMPEPDYESSESSYKSESNILTSPTCRKQNRDGVLYGHGYVENECAKMGVLRYLKTS